MFIINIVVKTIGPLIPLISQDLGIKFDIIGAALSISVLGVIASAFITCNLINTLDFKIVILIGLMFNIIGMGLIYFSKFYFIFIIALFLIRFGEGIINVSILSLIRTYYENSKTNSLLKLAISAMISNVVSPILISAIIFINFDWKKLFIVFIIPNILISIYLLLLKIPVDILNEERTFKNFYLFSLKKWANINFYLSFLIIFLHSGIIQSFYTWFTVYFSNIGIKLSISSLFLSLYGLSIVVGLSIKNKINKFLDEKKMLLYGYALSFITLISAIFINNLFFKNLLIFLFGLGISGNFMIAFSLGTEIDSKYINYASGLLVIASNLGILIFQYVIGFFSENFSGNSVFYVNVILVFMLLIIVLILNVKKDGRKFIIRL